MTSIDFGRANRALHYPIHWIFALANLLVALVKRIIEYIQEYLVVCGIGFAALAVVTAAGAGIAHMKLGSPYGFYELAVAWAIASGVSFLLFYGQNILLMVVGLRKWSISIKAAWNLPYG